MSNPVLQRLVDEREAANEAIDKVLDAANEEDRGPSETERELIGRYRSRLAELEPQIVELLELEETRSSAADARRALEPTSSRRSAGEPAVDAAEPEAPEGSYRTFAQYARDALIVRYPYIGGAVDAGARQRAAGRLQRAVETVLTTDVPGLVRPMWVNEIVGLVAASRPLVESVRMIGLTSGQLQYPKITAKPTVAQQVTEKTEVGVGTMTVAMATATAKTFLSSANFSWQTIQWSSPDALALWFDLCAADYAKKTDAELAGKLAAIDTTPATSVPKTLEGWTAAISAAAGAIYNATGRRADTVWSDVVTGYDILGLVSAQSPVFLSAGAGPTIGGLRLVISPSLPADTTVVGDSSAALCAETAGAPVELRAVEPSIGGLEVGIIGAFACELVDPAAFQELHTGATE